MRALYKEPGRDTFREIVLPKDDLKLYQRLVGGYIETVTIAEDACVICNEDGAYLGMPYNCSFLGISFVGPILIVGVDGDEFTDCPMSLTVANGGIE